MSLHSVCVYCGSSPGLKPGYLAAAEAFGRRLARERLTLVYGGGRVGLMGAVADGALSEGGRVVGVIPRLLLAKEVEHRGLTELRTVETMHERKHAMVELADAFVALPGGLGTLDEIAEVLTWGLLSLHGKPCALLNLDGYFDDLLRFFAHMVSQRFLRREQLDTLIVESDGEALLRRIREFTPVTIDKWLDRKPAAAAAPEKQP